MPRKKKRSNKYSLQISNFGRLRRGKGWRKYWNGESSERFGPTQFMVYYKGHYYNVDELARKTWKEEYHGMNIVTHDILVRQRSIRFRDKIMSLDKVSCLTDVSKQKLRTILWKKGQKVKGETLEYYYESPEEKPSAWYLPGEKWAYPKAGLCNILSKN